MFGNKSDIVDGVNCMCLTLQVGKQLNNKNVIEGSLKQKETSVITGATFSPDGTTLSVSCKNGVIRFYQVVISKKKMIFSSSTIQ